MSPAAARALERSNPQPNRLAILVERDGEILAQGQTSDGGLWAPPDRTWRVGIRVAPEWRRKRIATALAGGLESHARERHAARLISGIRGREPEGLAFAEAAGYREFHRRIEAYIDVAAFDPSRFDDPEEVAARAAVRFVSYGELWREHAADLEPLQRTLIAAFWEWARDVPSPAPLPAEPPPFDRAKRMFFDEPAADPDSTIVAMRGATPLGVTATTVKENAVALTNFTGVARAERGKGLALAMKLRALRSLKRRGIRLFGTTNDEQNAAMRGVNKRLGYVPEPPTIMVEKIL